MAPAVAWSAPVALDRTAVRFDAPETGGTSHPQFIFERELAFEARIEALADSDRAERRGAYLDRHVRSALESHIAGPPRNRVSIVRLSWNSEWIDHFECGVT